MAAQVVQALPGEREKYLLRKSITPRSRMALSGHEVTQEVIIRSGNVITKSLFRALVMRDLSRNSFFFSSLEPPVLLRARGLEPSNRRHLPGGLLLREDDQPGEGRQWGEGGE